MIACWVSSPEMTGPMVVSWRCDSMEPSFVSRAAASTPISPVRDTWPGATALVALVHDVIVVVGAFAVLGTVFGLEVDGLFVTAMLTIIGFSVHDTIVVYDRIRENRSRHAGERFSNIVNHSILQTLARSINTSLTVVFTLTALFLFGGDPIRPFVLALLIGIISGTYSSIFNAAPLLTVWEEWEARRKERIAPGRPVRRPSA